jgi:hypothetical protein
VHKGSARGGGKRAVNAARAINYGIGGSGSHGHPAPPSPVGSTPLSDVDLVDIRALAIPTWRIRGEPPAVPKPLPKPKTKLWESDDLPLSGVID